MPKHLSFASLLCLVIVCFALGISPTWAQRLGGLPDLTFNPADSGLPVPQLDRKNQLYAPGPDGGVIMSLYTNPRLHDQRGRHIFHFTSYYNRRAQSRYYNTYSYIPDQQGILMLAAPGRYYLAREGTGGYGQPSDSIRIIPFRPSETQLGARPPYPRAFYLDKPFRGFVEVGLTQVSPTRLVFFITRNSSDTVAPHNTTHVHVLDTAGQPEPLQIDIANFKAEAITSHNGLVYLLGRDIVNDTLVGESKMITLTAAGLMPVNPAPVTVDAALLADNKAQVFKVLPDGKFLVAGVLWHPVWQAHVNQAVRLLPNGSPDPGWAPSVLNGGASHWHLDDNLVLRAASVSSSGVGGQLSMVRIGPNGGLTNITGVTLDPSYPSPRPVMYQPDLNAFLLETGDLTPTRPPDGWNSGSYTDTSYGTRHRFYVGFDRQVRPLVNHHGVGMYGDYFHFNTHPVRDRILAYGSFTQINRQLRPMIALLRADGTTDTIFRPLHQMDEPLRSILLKYTPTSCQLTDAGRVLLNFPLYPLFNISDSTYRLTSTGNVDHTYARVWAPGTLIRRKQGGFVTVRAYTPSGDRSTLTSLAHDIDLRLVQLDAEGNLVREYGSFRPTGSPDTTAQVWHRWRDVYTEDEQGGVWAAQGWHLPIPGTNPQQWRYREYYVRYDSTGRSRVIHPDFRIVERPLKIEILPGNRMRLTGIFLLPNGTLAGRHVNVVETDSTGKLDVSVPPLSYFVPDGYGSRSQMYLSPRKYLADGKIITVVSTQSGRVNAIMRHFPDGRQDPSFLPIALEVFTPENVEVLGDRLYIGGENYGWLRFRNGLMSLYGGSQKNGLHAYRISTLPGTVGYVQGQVQQVVSPATGCSPAGTKRPATGMVMKATRSSRIAITDTGGYYFMALDTGRYTVSQQVANNFLQRQICPAAVGAGQPAPGRDVHLPRAGTTLLAENFINQTFDCPRLQVTVLQPRFRLCSRSTIRLQYQNDGMADEPAARIRLNLPEEIRIEASSHAFTRGADSSYVFDLGRLSPGQHGEVVLRDTIGCPSQPDSLARACYAARIEPLSLCSRIDPTTLNWDGAWIDAEARYQPVSQQVRVVIRNRGAAMADSTPLRLVNTRSAIYFDGRIKLPAGDSLVFEVPPAIQGSLFLAVRQTPNCPLGSQSSMFHSGTGAARTFLHFGSGLLESYTVQGCPTFRFSYDPNEKVVEPSGDIEPGTLLAYTIHFENFGNDTAYSVIVEDSLPPGLDVRTLRMTGSSTPCRLEVVGTLEQPVLYFYFNPIKLTAKKQDSVRSKGQVDFTIRTFDNVARGSVISNRAHIYFDRNEAVITDYVHSPIANPQLLAIRPVGGLAPGITLYPNPSQGTVSVRFPPQGRRAGLSLTVTSLQGQVIFSSPLPADGTLTLPSLRPGTYVVKVDGYKAQRLIIVR